MELRHLRYFLAVADAGGFTAAARRLHLAQPALSQQIRALEEELGVTLIERGARTRGLTDAGTQLALRARRMLLEAEAAVDEMAAYGDARRGCVRFGSALQSLTEGRLPRVLASFIAAIPTSALPSARRIRRRSSPTWRRATSISRWFTWTAVMAPRSRAWTPAQRRSLSSRSTTSHWSSPSARGIV